MTDRTNVPSRDGDAPRGGQANAKVLPFQPRSRKAPQPPRLPQPPQPPEPPSTA